MMPLYTITSSVNRAARQGYVSVIFLEIDIPPGPDGAVAARTQCEQIVATALATYYDTRESEVVA